jgi:RimJ/RimL family protein N-acetyltransferase
MNSTAAALVPHRPAAEAAPFYPTHLIDGITLANGRRAVLRPALAQDARLEHEFSASLAPAARAGRQRWVAGASSTDDVQPWNDCAQRLTLLVVVFEGPQEVQIAEARYVVAPDGRTAEFMLSVATAWCGQGAGSHLLCALCTAARGASLVRISGQVAAANLAMLQLSSRCGFAGHAHADDCTLVHVERSLEPAALRERQARSSLFGSLAQWMRPRRRAHGATA